MQLKVSIGQKSEAGRKTLNQDFHGVCIPTEPLLTDKGIVVALADGISSSHVSQIASETAVRGFLEDYYCTSESWSVKTSAQSVLLATNSWLYAQTHKSQYRYNKDKGYVCTFSALIIKSTTAHIFHAGDCRIYQLVEQQLQLHTQDHRVWESNEKSYLARALGVNEYLEIDYKSLSLLPGDVFVLATDGIYEFVSEVDMVKLMKHYQDDLDQAANAILAKAYQQGSEDNLTVQIIRIDKLPYANENEIYQQVTQRPFPPKLEARMLFDGYKIIRPLYISSRSYVYLAIDTISDAKVVIKVPSLEHRDNAAYLERFLLEEWIARRINNEHVLKPHAYSRTRNFLYTVTEYIEGQTLSQWMIDNPKPDIETVRRMIEQLAKGLRAFHRQEMLHQDLRPDNILIDHTGTAKIIDFGSTRVAGVMDVSSPFHRNEILGTAQYTAPEYFIGESGTPRSDQFSLGVIAYQMLSGKLPYGTAVFKARSKAAQKKLRYISVLDDEREIPAWMDYAIQKSVHPNPFKRYEEISEFIYALRHPSNEYLHQNQAPLIDRNPLLVWKMISLSLLIIVVLLLMN